MREEPATRAAIHVAAALQRAGARALVAGGEGPLIPELKAQGAEWLRLDTATVNPLRLRRNASTLERFLGAERVDIVHAHGAGAAWSALAATDRMAVWLVTSLPDIPPPKKSLRGFWQSALGRGDRVIAHSSFAAGLMIERFGIARDRVAVVPHGVDPLLFDPAAMRSQRVMALRQAWNIPQGDRVVLLPGQFGPASGQLILLEAAHWLVRNGLRGVTFVLLGENNADRKYRHALMKRARKHGIEPVVRLIEQCPDLAAAIAAADFVVVPALKPPLFGRPIPEAQTMARPVIASAIGILPENVLAPPRMPDDLRTGWLVPPDDPAELARALNHALGIDIAEYRALAARARQFAEFMFSPQGVAAAQLAVYSALLEGGG